MEPIIFLVDDEEEVRATLSRALKMRGFKVKAFSTAEQFLNAYQTNEIGCLVLDYGMPGMNGLQLQSELNERGISVPVIFISGHGGVPESVQAMKGGAVDFIQKPFRQAQLIKCIENAFEIDSANRVREAGEVQALEKFERLTLREREIADLIITNPSFTTSKHIGRELEISPRTVDHHRARILEKLEINSLAELIDLAARIDSALI